MRNKSKKLIAIMAAMMLATTSVAATATTAFATSGTIAVDPEVTTKLEVTRVDADDTTPYGIEGGEATPYIYQEAVGGKVNFVDLTSTYNFGNPVEPLKDKKLYAVVVTPASG
ncbi:MAG: hypothetical protein PUC32_05185, partial [Oscillospiraceae bacterium]|nr:hypothetical protein [Oscillospiraceae bacterium]